MACQSHQFLLFVACESHIAQMEFDAFDIKKWLENIEKFSGEKIDKNFNSELSRDFYFYSNKIKVKFNSNYMWQIYYSKNTDKYFMLVPTEDSEYEAFFYLLKKY